MYIFKLKRRNFRFNGAISDLRRQKRAAVNRPRGTRTLTLGSKLNHLAEELANNASAIVVVRTPSISENTALIMYVHRGTVPGGRHRLFTFNR